MPKHDPPGDDAALLELERELMELDRAIRAAEENREAIALIRSRVNAGAKNRPPKGKGRPKAREVYTKTGYRHERGLNDSESC